MPDVTEDFLSHYGVKGMHWGKHKSSGGGTVEKLSRSDKQVAKGDYKAKVKEARKDIYSDVKAGMSTRGQKTLAGASIAASLFTGGSVGSVVVGAQMMRAAGFSKGKTTATALIGGAPGAVLMIELQARKNARAA
jgi:hypothetical protein